MKATVRLFIVAAALGFGQLAQGVTTCAQTPSGMLCTAQVEFNRFAQSAFQTQNLNQWCWAASISMVFAYHGFNVSQARIVSDAYGGIVNMPAAGIVMAQTLNRPWVDDNQRAFVAHLSGAYDPAVGFSNLDNARLIAELDRNRPFIIGTAGHAVVATAMQYYVTPFGPNVVAVGVFDPWPGRGARTLSVAEMTPAAFGGGLSFVATADVQASTGSGSAIQNPFSSGSAGGASDPLMVVALLVIVLLSLNQRFGANWLRSICGKLLARIR